MDLDWEGLTVAFAARSMLMNHFLDRATGEVHAHLNGSPDLREALLHERSRGLSATCSSRSRTTKRAGSSFGTAASGKSFGVWLAAHGIRAAPAR
jgi:hypothetical protein